jgi:hypothetical protein
VADKKKKKKKKKLLGWLAAEPAGARTVLDVVPEAACKREEERDQPLDAGFGAVASLFCSAEDCGWVKKGSWFERGKDER